MFIQTSSSSPSPPPSSNYLSQVTHSRNWRTMVNFGGAWTSLTYLAQVAFPGGNAHSNGSHLMDIVPKREVLYVGGRYMNMNMNMNMNTTENATHSTSRSMAMTGQMYVEKLSPRPAPANPPLPIIFMAGAAQTGTNFLETPDGRPGWASFFLSKGHTVYLSDQPARGRSFWSPGQGSIASIGSPDFVSDIFTDAASNGNQWPQARLHTQWPGTGRRGDPAFDAFYSSQVQFQTDRFLSEEQNAQAYSALVDVVGDCYIISHSQAGAYAWRVGDMRPARIKAMIQLEPSGPPFTLRPPFGNDAAFAFGLTDHAIEYAPPAGTHAENLHTTVEPAIDADHDACIVQTGPARRAANLAGIPHLVVTGEASFHAPYDYCTVKYLRQVGVRVEHADLGVEGYRGNGHMFFMERNNLDIAERVYRWMGGIRDE